MSSGRPRLGHVEPRERVGAQTGRKYEYQYERTARAALDLLADDAKHVCVYCDWHDDYVVETRQPPTRYVFHQVKGRKSSQGPGNSANFSTSR
jgi:Cap4-like dsDNA endonuclease family protein